MEKSKKLVSLKPKYLLDENWEHPKRMPFLRHSEGIVEVSDYFSRLFDSLTYNTSEARKEFRTIGFIALQDYMKLMRIRYIKLGKEERKLRKMLMNPRF